MKKFEIPEMEVQKLEISDTITTSGGGEWNTPGEDD